MQPVITRQVTFVGLAVTAIASVAILLYVSIVRGFLPGIVELSTVLVVALIFGIVSLAPRGARRVIQERLSNFPAERVVFVAASVAVLAFTAVLALFIEGFPWPAPLLLVVLLLAFAISENEVGAVR